MWDRDWWWLERKEGGEEKENVLQHSYFMIKFELFWVLNFSSFLKCSFPREAVIATNVLSFFGMLSLFFLISFALFFAVEVNF